MLVSKQASFLAGYHICLMDDAVIAKIFDRPVVESVMWTLLRTKGHLRCRTDEDYS